MPRLDGSITLPTGLRLRTRMPQRSDAPRLHGLLHRLGLAADDLELSRMLRFDPRECTAVVACVLEGRSEEIVGLALMARFAGEPELVLADERRAPGAAAFLEQTLRAHGEHIRRSA